MTIRIKKDGDNTTLTVINSVLDSSDPSIGLTIADFRARAKVDRAIELIHPDAESFELTDANAETIKKAIEPVKWRARTTIVKSLISDLFGDEDEA